MGTWRIRRTRIRSRSRRLGICSTLWSPYNSSWIYQHRISGSCFSELRCQKQDCPKARKAKAPDRGAFFWFTFSTIYHARCCSSSFSICCSSIGSSRYLPCPTVHTGCSPSCCHSIVFLSTSSY